MTEEQKKRARLRSKVWGEKNKERVKKNFARWYKENSHRVVAQSKAWKEANPERFAENQAIWRKKNSARRCAQASKRKADVLRATPAWANEFFIDEIYDLAARRTAMKCGGIEKWHVDHIVPLKSKIVCGLHVEHNLRVIPEIENLKKQNFYWPDMP